MAALALGFRRSLALSARAFLAVAPKAAASSVSNNHLHTKQWNGPQISSLLVSKQVGPMFLACLSPILTFIVIGTDLPFASAPERLCIFRSPYTFRKKYAIHWKIFISLSIVY